MNTYFISTAEYIHKNLDTIKERLKGSFIAFNDFFECASHPNRFREWECRLYRVLTEDADLLVAKIVQNDDHEIYWGLLIAAASNLNGETNYQLKGGYIIDIPDDWKCDICLQNHDKENNKSEELHKVCAHCLECNYDACIHHKHISHPHSLFMPREYFGINTYEMKDSILLGSIDLF